jgi:hypothetical protein
MNKIQDTEFIIPDSAFGIMGNRKSHRRHSES